MACHEVPWKNRVDFSGVYAPGQSFHLRQVIYCSDWEDEQTGEIHCDCGLPIGTASKSNGACLGLQRCVPSLSLIGQEKSHLISCSDGGGQHSKPFQARSSHHFRCFNLLPFLAVRSKDQAPSEATCTAGS